MNYAVTAVGLALALGATSADAQTRKAQERETNVEQQPQAAATITVGDRTFTVTPDALPQIQELQAAVSANDTANIPGKLAAAKTSATTPDERYIVAKLQLQAALASKNQEALRVAMEEVLSTGLASRQEALILNQNLANAYLEANQHQQAAAKIQRVIELDPNNTEALSALSALYSRQGRHAEAIASVEKLMAASRAAGAKPPENLYKRAVAIAYKAKMPRAVELSRSWIAAYPTTEAWQNSLAIYQNLGRLDEAQKLDLLRLKRATGALTPGDYFDFGDIAIRKGFAGEAKSVLDEGFAASSEVKRSDPSFSQLYTLATQRTKGDRESLPATPPAGATARQILNTGDAYFGYGDYAKAVEFYRAALAKGGAEADLINLHIGMALARQGDKAGATAALNSVGGTYAQLAKYWLLYVSAQA